MEHGISVLPSVSPGFAMDRSLIKGIL